MPTITPERTAARFRLATAAVLVAVGGFTSGEASAQFFGRGGGMGGGSTVQGDILRGQGMAAWGLGQFNLATATATSINVDTAIRWNQYVYLSIEEDLHKKYLHRMAHKERNEANYTKNLSRILEAPNQADLRTGDALNFVLMQLIDPRISQSNYRNAVVPLAGDTIRKVPFHFAASAATFSMERLIGKREWPISLRGVEFARERKTYEKAVDAAIELDVEGKMTVRAVRAVQEAIDSLSIQIDLSIPVTSSDDLKQARHFVKRLADVPRILREGPVEKVIAEIETYPGTSVGDLLQFMQRHNLRFGVAESADENVLYAGLFDSFRRQREMVTLPPDAANGLAK